MSDETTPDNVTPINAPRMKPLSRTAAKRLMNASLARVNQETSAEKRRIAELENELRMIVHKVQDACAILEAVVRRHGQQSFDRKEIATTCARGRIAWELTPTRITLKLQEDNLDSSERDTSR